MIYFNGTEFTNHKYKAVYTNNADGKERVKYTSDKEYWEEFVSRWGSGLEWTDVTLTPDQQARLDLLNEQDGCCSQWDAQASLFVVEGVIYRDDVPPYLEGLLDDYGVDRVDSSHED